MRSATLPLFIARRLRLNRSDDGSKRASTGSAIAVAGIAISFVVMLLSVAVMTGFKHEIKAKIMGFDSQIIVYPPTSSVTGVTGTTLSLNDTLSSILESALPPQAVTSLNINVPVIFKTSDDFQGMIIRGLSNRRDEEFIGSNLTAGAMPDFQTDSARNSLVIPEFMARRLKLGVGDKVMAYFIDNESVRARNMPVAGIYDTHFSDYDKVYAFASTEFLQGVRHLSSTQGSSIAINNVGNEDQIDALAGQLQAAIYDMAINRPGSPLYQVRSVHQTGAVYFSWLDLLDTNVVVILTLMALVAGFTLISSLFIIILERVNMIGILKAMGMSTWTVVKIFIFVAERLVMRGLLIGNLVAGVIVFIQSTFHLIPLDPDSYYLSYVPVEVDAIWWIALNLAVVIMAALVLVAPARVIADIKPTTAIRYD